jgi:hypothetical protein
LIGTAKLFPNIGIHFFAIPMKINFLASSHSDSSSISPDCVNEQHGID